MWSIRSCMDIYERLSPSWWRPGQKYVPLYSSRYTRYDLPLIDTEFGMGSFILRPKILCRLLSMVLGWECTVFLDLSKNFIHHRSSIPLNITGPQRVTFQRCWTSSFQIDGHRNRFTRNGVWAPLWFYLQVVYGEQSHPWMETFRAFDLSSNDDQSWKSCKRCGDRRAWQDLTSKFTKRTMCKVIYEIL